MKVAQHGDAERKDRYLVVMNAWGFNDFDKPEPLRGVGQEERIAWDDSVEIEQAVKNICDWFEVMLRPVECWNLGGRAIDSVAKGPVTVYAKPEISFTPEGGQEVLKLHQR